MKKYRVLLLIAVMSLTSCVQKSHKRTVVFLLDVSGIKDLKSVGIRGSEKPFSWDYDTEMEVIKKDSLYKKSITVDTGRLCLEVKFTVNGDFELKDQNNRKVYYSTTGTTNYKAKFNVMK
jgi:hypothetical protein